MNTPVAPALRLASLFAGRMDSNEMIRAVIRRPAPDIAHLAALKRRERAL